MDLKHHLLNLNTRFGLRSCNAFLHAFLRPCPASVPAPVPVPVPSPRQEQHLTMQIPGIKRNWTGERFRSLIDPQAENSH